MKNILFSTLILFVFAFDAQSQTQDILWLGRNGNANLNIPLGMQGEANAQTETHSQAIKSEKMTGTATLRLNPDGKIVSVEIRSDNRVQIDKNCLLRSDCFKACDSLPVRFGCYLACIIIQF
jgi:hypothetical protein